MIWVYVFFTIKYTMVPCGSQRVEPKMGIKIVYVFGELSVQGTLFTAESFIKGVLILHEKRAKKTHWLAAGIEP